jgi:hypothetical protein
MGDHIVIFGLTEVRILGDRPTEVYDAENTAISLTLGLGGQMGHELVVSLDESALPPQK